MEKVQRYEYDLKKSGEAMKRARIDAGLTVKEVREYLEVGTVQAIYKWEAGKGFPQADRLMQLAELYGVKVEELMIILGGVDKFQDRD